MTEASDSIGETNAEALQESLERKRKTLTSILDAFIKFDGLTGKAILRSILSDLSNRSINLRIKEYEPGDDDCYQNLTDADIQERKFQVDVDNTYLTGDHTRLRGAWWTSDLIIRVGSSQLKVFCGLSYIHGFLGPFFYDELGEKSLGIGMMNTHVLPYLKEKKLHYTGWITFQNDSSSIKVDDLDFFDNQSTWAISPTSSRIPWPSKSRDLTPVRFWFEERLKALLALQQPKTKQEVKYWVKALASRISKIDIWTAIDEAELRLRTCNLINGRDVGAELRRIKCEKRLGKECCYCHEVHRCPCEDCIEECLTKTLLDSIQCFDQTFLDTILALDLKTSFNISNYVNQSQQGSIEPFDFKSCTTNYATELDSRKRLGREQVTAEVKRQARR